MSEEYVLSTYLAIASNSNSSIHLVPYSRPYLEIFFPNIYFYLPRDMNSKYEKYLLLKHMSFYPECYLLILCSFSKCIILTVLLILGLHCLKW